MTAIPFEQISAAALAQAPALLAEWLPNGKRAGREFKIGNLTGDPGESLSVNLDTGLWSDFATGQGGRDLIDLRAALHHSNDRVEAARELRSMLGLAPGANVAAANRPSRAGPMWQPICPPPPETAGAGDLLNSFDTVYEYTDGLDRITHYVGRIEARGGRSKSFVPITYGVLNGRTGWHKKAPATPRPLYGLNRLATMANSVVILCEGEKAADAAQAMLPGFACLTWHGGAGSVHLADFAPLRGRQVIVWPDADAAGAAAAAKIAAIIPSARVLLVTDLADGADAADLVVDDPEEWLLSRLAQLSQCEATAGVDADMVQSSVLPLGPIAEIPPRPWAYGSFLLRGSASVIGAVDGGGKGAIAVGMTLAMITGKPLLGEGVSRTGPVAIVSYEDDADEWRRRIAAACVYHHLDYATVLPQIKFIAHAERRISFGDHGTDGLVFPHSAAVIRVLIDMKAVLMLVDPFNHAHGLQDGNNNALVAQVAGELTRIAREAKVATLVLHHLRKGAAGNPDDLMGATSLRATFRSCRILARMTPEAASKMNISDPWRYVRIAGSKENYAPPSESSTWYKLTGVPLGNGNDEYPAGDDVAVAELWTSRPLFDEMDECTLRAVFDALRREHHSPVKQARRIPWAGKILMEIGKRSEAEAKKILARWTESSVIRAEQHYEPGSRNQVQRIVLDEDKVAEVLLAQRQTTHRG